MAVPENTYRKLNPFLNRSVGENEIWGDEDGGFCDVESIHGKVFHQLLAEIEQVNSAPRTRARFLVGAAGTGKSHLFARLRRKMGNGQFTFVSNPPADHWAIKRHILKKVISGMRRPVLTESGPLPYSQLQRVVYALLRRIRSYPGLRVNDIHKAWKRVDRKKYYPTEEELFANALENLPEMDIPLHVRRVLFRVLDEEKRRLATEWLSGSQALTDNDYEKLGVNAALEDHEVPDLLKQLGSLSIDAGPIVLVLDQLDGLRKSEQIGELESLMIDLNDASKNWYLIVSLVVERYQFWNDILSDPFRGRFGTIDGGMHRLKVSELAALTPEQARELLSVRLSSSELRAQRERDSVGDPSYPLPKERVEELAESGASSARALLQRASDAYVEAVSGIRPVRRQLAEFLGSTFTDIKGHLCDDDLLVDSNLVADRIKELFNLISVAYTGSGLEPQTGPLHGQTANFRGTDRIYRCNDRQIRVVGHDVQHGNSFPSVLNRIVDAPSSTILVRDGRIRATGRATTKLLTRFRQDKNFVHMPLHEIKNLHALGALLAKMSEGDFEHERTDPPPTEENILRCLALYEDLVDSDLAREFVRLVGLEEGEEETSQPADAGDETQTKTERTPPPVASDSIVQLVTQIMEGERWLVFERLCARVLSRGVSASPDQVCDCLKAVPLCEKVMVYPTDSSPLEAPGIIVWTVEA